MSNELSQDFDFDFGKTSVLRDPPQDAVDCHFGLASVLGIGFYVSAFFIAGLGVGYGFSVGYFLNNS